MHSIKLIFKMSSHSHHLLLPILIAFSLIIPSKSAGIAVYWGQHGHEEGNLTEACATGYYQYVNVAYLSKFGNGTDPQINLADHCIPGSSCEVLSIDIRYCQSLGVEVLLSLEGGNALNSSDDAKQVAEYLYNNFLWGNSSSRPFGDAVLDGIDFDIIGARSLLYWDDLARALDGYRGAQTPIRLSASPQCPIPDVYLDAAIQTGLFDYVWIKFYDNPSCDYSGGADALKVSWKDWSKHVPVGKIFLGLPAADQDPISSGYIEPKELESKVLPDIKSVPNYGGLMLWDRLLDKINQYSANLTDIGIFNDQGLHYSG